MTIELSLLISIFSLLVTIIGWGITAYFQKKLLDKQIQAENTRISRQLYIPQRIMQLEKIKNWLQEGIELAVKINNRKDKPSPDEQTTLYKQYQAWRLQFVTLAPLFVSATSKYRKSSLDLWTSIGVFFKNLVQQIGDNEQEAVFFNERQEIAKIFATIIIKGHETIRSIDYLIEKVAIDSDEE